MNGIPSHPLLWAALLVSTRLAPVFLSLPLFSYANVPVRFRVMFVITLAFVLVAGAGKTVVVPDTALELVLALLSEAFTGALMAFGVAAAFSVFHLAGGLFDFQVGFGIANVIDPINHHQEPLVGGLLRAMAIGVFFAVGAHHLLLKGLLLSLERIPPGHLFLEFNLSAVVAQFGLMFTLGLAMVMPVVISLIVVDVATGIASRFMPQMNVFVTVMPVKIVLGFLVLIVTLGHAGPLIERTFMSIFDYWDSVAT
jgi:flagellar biosynthetic protein FliR